VDVREPQNRSACQPAETDGPRIVMLCAELSDVELIALSLQKLNTGSLLTYDRPAQLRLNPPVGEIALFVLIDRESLESTADTLRWLARYWPQTARVVVGETGSGRQELMARMGGAIYLVYPVPRKEWQSLVRLAVQRANRADTPAA
jgi:hypothetical protein